MKAPMPKRVLVTWIGHADLIAYSRLGSPSKKDWDLIHELVPASKAAPKPVATEGIGPVKALINKQTFSETHLIGNYEKSLIQHFGKWLNVCTVPHQVDVSNPSDHGQIHDVTVLVLGESGTGKEMFAEAIHRASSRGDKKMQAINCAAISKDLIESELFGHVKGAFTNADTNRKGLFDLAHGSTLFLDEVGECDLGLQAKLLRALQPPHDQDPCHRVFRPVGASADETSDVRVIAANNKDLRQMLQDGTFREDLLYRLATITLKLPPLRERGKDIVALAESMLVGINAQFSKLHASFYVEKFLSAGAKSFIRKQTWPGNVRELRNALIQSAVMSTDKNLTEADLAAALSELPNSSNLANELERPMGDGFDLEKQLDVFRKQYLSRAWKESNGIKVKATELLCLKSHQTLTNQMTRLGVPFES